MTNHLVPELHLDPLGRGAYSTQTDSLAGLWRFVASGKEREGWNANGRRKGREEGKRRIVKKRGINDREGEWGEKWGRKKGQLEEQKMGGT